jgi:hypothetical protein
MERVEALMTAAVIKYTRCFTTGVPMKLRTSDSYLVEMNARFHKLHDYYVQLRSRFVAHAINAFEDTYVITPVAVKDGVRLPLYAVSAGQNRLVLSTYNANELLELMKPVRNAIDLRIKAEEKKLLVHLQSLPMDVVHAWDLHSASAMSPAEVKKPRKRSRRAAKKT